MPPALPLPSALLGRASFDRARAAAVGVTGRRLAGRRYVRVTGGRHLVAGFDDERARWAAVLRALPDGAALSHGTASTVLGLPTVPGLPAPTGAPPRIDVTVPPPGIPSRRPGVVCLGRSLPPGDVILVDGLMVTSPERLFLDAAALVGREWLVALGDAVLAARWATPESLAMRVAAAGRVRGVVLARRVLPLLDWRAQSPPESVLRVRLADAGIPLIPQCEVRNGAGRVVARVDLGDPVRRIAVEYEGRQHAEGVQFDRDIERYSMLAGLGWLVVRAGRHDAADDYRAVIAHVRAALAR